VDRKEGRREGENGRGQKNGVERKRVEHIRRRGKIRSEREIIREKIRNFKIVQLCC
jgi:hypothetical protein